MRLSDKAYDTIKTIQRWLPLVSTLYVALASIWAWPLADEVSKTLMAVAAFLAGILEVATAAYNKDQSQGEENEIRPLDEVNADIVSHEDVDGVG